MTDDETNRAAAVTGNSSSPQAADIRDRWWWVEHSVWTERMLTRLEQSEPTTKWFRLWDKVLSERNLQAAFWAVWRNEGAPGVDGQTVKQFDEHAETELARLREELHTKRYRRQPARRVWIPKPGTTGKRPLGIPAVRERTVEAATRNVLEPIFERDFAEHSYGFRPGRGCREAVGLHEPGGASVLASPDFQYRARMPGLAGTLAAPRSWFECAPKLPGMLSMN